MNWKEFLKKDWRKVATFIIIFMIFTLMPIWTTIRCSTWECGPGPSASSFFNSLESMKNKEFFDFGYFTLWIVIFCISLILSYIISNFIVRIYDKTRKVKKK